MRSNEFRKVYHRFRVDGLVDEEPGFARVASLDEVRAEQYALAPGRYVGAADDDAEELSLAEVLPELTTAIFSDIEHGAELDAQIRQTIEGLVNGG